MGGNCTAYLSISYNSGQYAYNSHMLSDYYLKRISINVLSDWLLTGLQRGCSDTKEFGVKKQVRCREIPNDASLLELKTKFKQVQRARNTLTVTPN